MVIDEPGVRKISAVGAPWICGFRMVSELWFRTRRDADFRPFTVTAPTGSSTVQPVPMQAMSDAVGTAPADQALGSFHEPCPAATAKVVVHSAGSHAAARP